MIGLNILKMSFFQVQVEKINKLEIEEKYYILDLF